MRRIELKRRLEKELLEQRKALIERLRAASNYSGVNGSGRGVADSDEEALYRRELRRLDRHTLERIERRFGGYIPPERLEEARRRPVEFQRHRKYLEHLKREGLRPAERERILGDFDKDERVIYIDREHILVPKTLAHERLHQLGDERFRALLGSKLDEGMTEHLAREIATDPELVDVGKCYPRERRIIEMLSARVGEDTLKRAYFQGDWLPLKQRLDRELGEGALAEIARLTEAGRHSEAEEIIKGGL